MTGVDEVPNGVDAHRWRGSSFAPPAVGDLWLLSWDGEALGLGVVSGVAPNYVLVWPASLPADPAFPPAVHAAESPLGVALAVWPTRETGIGLHLLDRRFGQFLSERTMALTIDAVEAGEDPPLPWVASDLPEADRELASDAMIDRWEAICLHTWPTADLGTSPLSADALAQADIGIADLVDLLDVGTPDAVALYRGELAPSAEQVNLLAGSLDWEPSDLVEVAGEARLLSSPEFKADLVETARALDIDEGQARNLVRSEVALAARSDGDPSSRVEAAIQRVRQRETD